MNAVELKSQTINAKKLAGKVVLVTGGSRGIGAGIALKLAEEGAHVAITYAKNKTAANEVVQRLSQLEVKAAAFQGDTASSEQSEKLVQDVIKEFGQIDILVNNAGVFETEALENISIEHYQRVFDVNVKGVIASTIAALKHIPNGGRIINISSVAAKGSGAGFSVYSASKAALDTLTRIWAQDLGARQITVNAVAPGPTASDMFDSVPEEMKAEFISKTALKRLGQPDDIAAVVAFLASAEGRWVTGQTIVSDGGITV